MNVNIFMDNVFDECDQEFFAYMPDPKRGWANIGDCGNFPCTAPFQALWQFYRNKFTNPGSKISQSLDGDFQIIADNSGFGPHIDNCDRIERWNAFLCRTKNFGILSFESNDPDKMDRSSQPIYLSKEGST